MHISFKNSEGLNVCNCHENNATMHKTISVFLKVGFIFFRQTWFGVVILSRTCCWQSCECVSYHSLLSASQLQKCSGCTQFSCRPQAHCWLPGTAPPQYMCASLERPTHQLNGAPSATHTQRSSSDWCNRATLSHWHNGKQIKHTQMKCFCSELVLS